ncbi:MAG: phenylalanine--tRNA ligase subunit alpha [Parcubacteria group bacterium SW_6_46_9]|nr:MAG: phenylalanine--tRNA ligase subunit alpha [Parcubacteria group bacterium SW_6_46_9]
MAKKHNKTNGHLHPLSKLQREINDIFYDLGFAVAEGPEAEDEFHNFDALNIPEDHPARDLWDTFWLKDNNLGELLRTQTSSVQIRHMEDEDNEPPFQIIAPGKVYRYEATDATHETQFYQLEGLMIDNNITLADLRGVLAEFFAEFYDDEMDMRLRPSYFPFTEPSVEVDMRPAGNPDDEWVEILGAGMVHPHVLESVGVNPHKWQGFAFGMGIDRLAMLKHGVEDVRLFYNGDLRLVNQF